MLSGSLCICFKLSGMYNYWIAPQVDKMLAEDIAKLMNAIPLEEQTKRNEGMDRIEGGAFEGVMDSQTPFQVSIDIEYN